MSVGSVTWIANKTTSRRGNKMLPVIRDRVIELACSNLIMAGVLELPVDIKNYSTHIATLPDVDLAKQLVSSRILLEKHLCQLVETNRN